LRAVLARESPFFGMLFGFLEKPAGMAESGLVFLWLTEQAYS
jgi:hypothetical protein